MLKWIGLICIAGGASAVGFGIAANVKRQTVQLRQLQSSLCYMKNEILCRMTPLPELFRLVSEQTPDAVGRLFETAAAALEKDKSRSAASSLAAAIRKTPELTFDAQTERTLLGLAMALGQFDAEGQTRAIELAECGIADRLADLEKDAASRCRSYRTLGVCAGLAIAVILL